MADTPYFDPYDLEIDRDPYPYWKRLRDEAPLYWNEQHEFFALSRYDDVRRASAEWETYISGNGSVLEIIKSGAKMPPGIILFEDPPEHNIHRGMLSRIFHPRAMEAIEPMVRRFCQQTLDPLVGSGGFDFIENLGAFMPMRVIGMLLGIPEDGMEMVRERMDDSLRIRTNEAGEAQPPPEFKGDFGGLNDYVEWRANNPSDDLMTKLLNAEYETPDGPQQLTRQEVLNYVGLIAGAGSETTTRLIGWAGKVLAENPDQRAELAKDPSLIPAAIEELLRYEAPSPVQARTVTKDVEHYGQTVPEGSIMILLNGSANRDERRFPDPDRFDIHRTGEHHVSFGYGLHFCLGAALARLEGRVALEEVLKRFPTWDVDWDNAVQAHTSTVRGWEKMPVTVP